MTLETIYPIALDVLRFAVLPLLWWLWRLNMRVQENSHLISQLKQQQQEMDVTQLQVTLAEIQKDIQHIRENQDKAHQEMQRQKDFLNNRDNK